MRSGIQVKFRQQSTKMGGVISRNRPFLPRQIAISRVLISMEL